jgi:hypothetical protein
LRGGGGRDIEKKVVEKAKTQADRVAKGIAVGSRRSSSSR